MILQGKARYPVSEVVLHCAGIKTGQFAHMRPFQVFATVNRWHIERGFKNGFGYHGLFMPDGTFYAGRPYEMIGAHCIEANRGTLGFLMIESVEIKPPVGVVEAEWLAERHPTDWFRQAQIDAVLAHIRAIPGIKRVSGHNDYAAKLCPGFKVKSEDWL